MPTVNNRGRFYWGSAWRLEPRRGNGRCKCTGLFSLRLGLRLEPRRAMPQSVLRGCA